MPPMPSPAPTGPPADRPFHVPSLIPIALFSLNSDCLLNFLSSTMNLKEQLRLELRFAMEEPPHLADRRREHAPCEYGLTLEFPRNLWLADFDTHPRALV